MSVNTNTKVRAMYDEYGMGCGTCRRCCNLQFSPKGKTSLICIAYGYREDVNCTWEEDNIACGLFNKPFLALVPAHRPLVDLLPPPRKTDDSDDQISFF